MVINEALNTQRCSFWYHATGLLRGIRAKKQMEPVYAGVQSAACVISSLATDCLCAVSSNVAIILLLHTNRNISMQNIRNLFWYGYWKFHNFDATEKALLSLTNDIAALAATFSMLLLIFSQMPSFAQCVTCKLFHSSMLSCYSKLRELCKGQHPKLFHITAIHFWFFLRITLSAWPNYASKVITCRSISLLFPLRLSFPPLFFQTTNLRLILIKPIVWNFFPTYYGF